MKEKEFDDIIKSKLNRFVPEDSSAGAWENFETSRQGASMSSDEDFDQIIKSKIIEVRTEYRPIHWRHIKNQLKLIQERKNTIYISKSLELIAITLIVFTFIHWAHYIDVLEIKNKPATSIEFASETGSFNANSSQIGTIAQAAVAKNNSNLVTSNKDQKVPFSKSATRQFNTNQLLANDPSIKPEEGAPIQNTQPIATRFNDKPLISNLHKPGVKIKHEAPLIPDPVFAMNEVSQIARIMPTIWSEQPLIIPLSIIKTSSIPKTSLSGYVSADVNLINTPFDKIYSKASYNKEAINHSFGLSVSKKFGSLESELGLGYAQRTYQPEKISEVFNAKENSYSEVSFNKISYDIATLPFSIKYHFINKSKWSAYMMANITLNMVMNAEYGIKKVEVYSRPASGLRYEPDPRLDEKPFIGGLLAGDRVKDDYFISAGFGFGIEKVVFKNTSVFLQPSYHRHILADDIGIGPNKDKIHTSSLQFGVKTVLN